MSSVVYENSITVVEKIIDLGSFTFIDYRWMTLVILNWEVILAYASASFVADIWKIMVLATDFSRFLNMLLV